jgi:hypothetical protein
MQKTTCRCARCEGICGTGSLAPSILNVDGGEVSFMNWALYLPGRICWQPLNTRLGGGDSHLEVLDKKEIFVAAGDRTRISLLIQSVDNSLYWPNYPFNVIKYTGS